MTELWTATRENGDDLELGPDGTSGPTPYTVSAFEAYGSPDVRNADQESSGADVMGLDVETGRRMVLTVAPAPHRAAFADRVADFEDLAYHFRVGREDIHLKWVVDGIERSRWVKSRGIDDKTDPLTRYLNTGADILLRAYPRTYGAEQTFEVDGTATEIEYGGSFPTSAWILTVDGPCTVPTFKWTNPAGGTSTVQLPDLVYGGTIPTGWQLVVDARKGFAYLIDPDGGPHGNLKVTDGSARPPFFYPLARVSGTVQFLSTTGSTSASLSVRPAYY